MHLCNLLLIVMGKFSSILVFFRPEKAKQVLYVRLHFFYILRASGLGFLRHMIFDAFVEFHCFMFVTHLPLPLLQHVLSWTVVVVCI